jgi:hypothetical protein
MTSFVPDLDTTTFDELVREGRALIPAYAPDWTDHNLHDPGITLIDLIAYLADQHVYRIGFVGDSLQAAFTRLMGVAPRGPEPAQVLIWPKPGATVVGDFEAGTVIDTPDIEEARWTLDVPLRTISPHITSLATVTGTQRKEVGIGLVEGRDPLPLAAFAGGGPRSLEIELSDNIIPLAQDGWISLGLLFGTAAPEKGPDWDPVAMDQWDDGGFWRPLTVTDTTMGLREDGVILFRMRDQGAAKRFRIRLNAGFRPGPVTLTRIGFNVLPATEGWDSPGNIEIARGNGLPDQLVAFDTEGLVEAGHLKPPLPPQPRQLVISTSLNGQLETWSRVESFASSDPLDRHYMITEKGLVFGNGLNGRTAPSGAQILHAPLRRTTGSQGAVSRGLRWRIAKVDFGENLTPSRGGRDRDQLSDLLTAARTVAASRSGNLRKETIRNHLLSADFGLEEVYVLARRRPGREDLELNGNRTVLVLPKRDPGRAPPAPDTVLVHRIAQSLETGRLLGERVHVSPPRYRWIDVSLTLTVEADSDLPKLETKARDLLARRLWDIPRRPDQEIKPWPPGRPVSTNELQSLMTAIPEVIAVPDCRIGVAGTSLSEAAIHLGTREIALLNDVSLTLMPAVEGGRG